ncbi:energy transducer TonB [Mucilaginibacter roseus]|uniref:Energy transducer TonB n=1 Tax=Mucilaginibacter roseus TaxID=1528868 RepID=A0ABS8U378_9SPHI|nr:energy transducer TonB [Mucilaginibacter roseus]MCD8739973.1 energy transducer TonB [Mucilaginibacter roseus]
MNRKLSLYIAIACIGYFSNASAQQLNKKLIAEIKDIYNADQYYRVATKKAADLHGWDSPETDSLMRLQGKADIENTSRITAIIDQYGYPGKSLVGKQNASLAFMVIQHSDAETQRKYLPVMTKAANRGELAWRSLALLIDRVKTGQNEKQVYGTQLWQMGNSVKLYPIADEAGVNIRRKKIGLPPLETYLQQWNIKYKVPTQQRNPNPEGLYYSYEQREESPVELIGGEKALYAKIKYPESALKEHVSGWITVELTVDKDGKPKNLSVVKGLGHGCDEEAVRVMSEARFTNKTGEDHDMRYRLPFAIH